MLQVLLYKKTGYWIGAANGWCHWLVGLSIGGLSGYTVDMQTTIPDVDTALRAISGYPESLQQQVRSLITQGKLADYLLSRYPTAHAVPNDKALRSYVLDIKNHYLKQSSPLSKVIYDPTIHVVNQALGLHSTVSRVQGGKLKSKRELRVSTLFKKVPEPFLNMIVVHELAHLKERDHNKNFYKLCHHMLPEYGQLELDTRLYLIQLDIGTSLYG
jgi:predicted metal-dependent hydrolase